MNAAELVKLERLRGEILAGDIWHLRDEPELGPIMVVGKNDSSESPPSYVMLVLLSGRTVYMHRSAREAGRWRRGAP